MGHLTAKAVRHAGPGHQPGFEVGRCHLHQLGSGRRLPVGSNAKAHWSLMMHISRKLPRIAFAGFCAALLSGPALQANDDKASPLGLWEWRTDESVPDKPIIIRRNGETWTATIGGEQAPIRANGDRLVVEGEGGYQFQFDKPKSGEFLVGNWIQPSSALGYARMASPTLLELAGPDAWEGVLQSQPRPFRVFLEIFEKDGDRFAVLRNPERNELQYSTIYRLELDQTSGGWLLKAGEGDRAVQIPLERRGEGGLELPFQRFPDPLEMTQTTADRAPGYLSRVPADVLETTSYAVPATLDDGWPVASASEAGFDAAILDELLTELSTLDPRDRRPRMMHSLLVSHRGKLVIEEYFFGHDRKDVHDIRSLGKVFGSVLVGALRQKGVDIGPQNPALSAVENANFEPGSDKADITLGQLMSYTSGLDCDDNDAGSLGNEDTLWSAGGPDFWSYAANLEQKHPPGERYAYCSASINLAGATIRQKAGAPILDTFDSLIARPLAFSTYHWNLMPNGEAYLGGGAYMLPRDILKIGALYANKGVWNGRRIIPEAWVETSTAPKIAISPETTGMDQQTFQNSYFGGEQAFVWRVDDLTVGDRSFAAYEATGNGGQVLLVIPELEMAAVMTGGNYRMGGIWGRWRDQVIAQGVLRSWIAGQAKDSTL